MMDAERALPSSERRSFLRSLMTCCAAAGVAAVGVTAASSAVAAVHGAAPAAAVDGRPEPVGPEEAQYGYRRRYWRRRYFRRYYRRY